MKAFLLIIILSPFILGQDLKTGTGVRPGASPASISKMWDLHFLYYASLYQGDQGNAGAAYIPQLREIWTSHWNSESLYRWTAHAHGTTGIIDSVYPFTIKGVSNVRGMTYDGSFVYAVNNTDTIYKIDPVRQSLAGKIIVPSTLIRYITFDASADMGHGGFWIGNFETDPELIDYTGYTIDFLSYAQLGVTNIYGAAVDRYSPGGPFLWVFGQNMGYGFPQEICQIDIATGQATGVKHDVSTEFLTYSDSLLAGGLFISNDLVSGKVTLGGVLQAVGTDFLFGYEVSESTIIPVKILLNQTFTFGDCTKSSSYKIISLPGDVNIPAEELLAGAGEHKKNWNIYYDNGKTSNYLIEYSSASGFSFQPGRAFWAVSRTPFSISRQVNAVPTASEGWFSIPLHEGWNLIADPFDIEINWAAVRLANGLGNNENIYSWNGAWSNPSAMRPYEGYYYYNANNLPSLIAPMMAPLRKSAEDVVSGSDNIIKAYLLQDGKEYSPVYAAVNAASKPGYDNADLFAPPSDFAELSLSLRNDILETDYKNLFIDARPSVGEGQEYRLISKNKTGSTAQLVLEAKDLPSGTGVCIYDEKLGNALDLSMHGISLNPYPENREYLLLIGSSEYIKSKAAVKIPDNYSLNQNFPNPFNSSTVVSYALPVKSRAEITVYDALGQKLKTLFNGEQTAGKHEILFDAGGYSAGIYFCTLRTPGYTSTIKLILLK